jgi:hypothetical protein
VALIDQVKAICDRLAPLGWGELLKEVSDRKLDIAQQTPQALQKALTAHLPHIDRTLPGFEDFDSRGEHGITAGQPSQSLLYHALASPYVLRDGRGLLLQGYPTLAEIETVENFVFGIQPPTLDALAKRAPGSKLAIVVFATEYRPCADTADGAHADLTFSRTGIARIGTSRAKWFPDIRGYWPEDDDNPHGFRVVPVRLTAWLAAATKGQDARVMRLVPPDDKEKKRIFWVPVHKLYDGRECIDGLDLSLVCSAKFFNMKLQRVMKSLKQNVPAKYPYVIEDDLLAELEENSEHGRIAVAPVVQNALVQPAVANGKPLTFLVPKRRGADEGFATYQTPTRSLDDDTEVHPYPAYVHARTRVVNNVFVDLNEEEHVDKIVERGDYHALLHVDMTGEGWVDVKVPQLARDRRVAAERKPAYVLLSAPDFFPSCGQRELSRWSTSPVIPAHFRGQLWGVAPTALSETRRPANLQLPNSPFDPDDDAMTAVIGMGHSGRTPLPTKQPDAVRASTLPDDGAGEFAPGWDVAVDVKKDAKGRSIAHLAAYGLGSPFPEDAKLCAALSTFWPAVAPDVYRTMSMQTGSADLRGTVAPLTDQEIGQIGSLPWDGVAGPKIIQHEGKPFAEMASFLNVDYVTNAMENRFSNRLTSRITAEEYERRVIAAARVHWVLSGGTSVAKERRKWLFLSFRTVASGDPELLLAQDQTGHVFDGVIYRVETCFVGNSDPSIPSPRGPRFRLLPIVQRNFLFVSAEDSVALRRRDENPQWGRASAE